MGKYNRVFVVVMDSLGIGAMPDADKFGDAGADTLGHISETVEHLNIPSLQRLGMANLKALKQVQPAEKPLGYYAVLREKSNGKDTMTGHWEMMGIHTTKPFITFTETGFPKELIDELEKRTGRTIIGNKAASGTEILEELAEQERAIEEKYEKIEEERIFDIVSKEAIKSISGKSKTRRRTSSKKNEKKD